VTYLDIGKDFLQPDGTLTKDIMPDLLHPSAKGYEIWANAVTPVFQKYFPQLQAAAPAAPAPPVAK
jgi:lysophospholipase L1-like esterase